MPASELTPRLQGILRNLVQSARLTEDRFRFYCNSAFCGAAFLKDNKYKEGVDLRESDLEILSRFGFVHFNPSKSFGQVMAKAYLAVDSNFAEPQPRTSPSLMQFGNINTGGGSVQIANGTGNVQYFQHGNNAVVIEELCSLGREIVGQLYAVLSATEADAAKADIEVITEQVKSERPERQTISARLTSLYQRTATAIAAAATVTAGVQRAVEVYDKLRPWSEKLRQWATAHGI